MSKPALYLLLCVVLWGCSPEHPGFTELEDELYFKLHYLGDGGRAPQKGDFLTVSLRYRTLSDSIIYETPMSRRAFDVVEVRADAKPGSLESGLAQLLEGDSASFIMPTKRFFTSYLQKEVPAALQKEASIRIDLKLVELRNADEFMADQRELEEWIANSAIAEEQAIADFLRAEGIDSAETRVEGMHLYFLKRTKKSKPQYGDRIYINYIGRFMDGTEFDNTYKSKVGMEFGLGDPDQVIRGFELALPRMREGEKALFIIPSALAFGPYGSSNGMVPAFTPVVYEVELTQVASASPE